MTPDELILIDSKLKHEKLMKRHRMNHNIYKAVQAAITTRYFKENGYGVADCDHHWREGYKIRKGKMIVRFTRTGLEVRVS